LKNRSRIFPESIFHIDPEAGTESQEDLYERFEKGTPRFLSRGGGEKAEKLLIFSLLEKWVKV